MTKITLAQCMESLEIAFKDEERINGRLHEKITTIEKENKLLIEANSKLLVLTEEVSERL